MSNLHALLLYPVIKNLVDHLDFHDLLPFRQVCSTWKNLADINLQERTKVKITSLNELEKFSNGISPDTLLFTDYEFDTLRLEQSHNFFERFGTNIISLKLSCCDWKSTTLRTILFKKLPNLKRIELSTNKNSSHWLDPLLPMSFIRYSSFPRLVNLKDLRIIGDYSNRTDLFYDLLKSAPNLEVIRQTKYNPDHDDLFGTWLTEIILSCDFFHLKCLDLNCNLIQQQIHAIVSRQYPLTRLCIEMDFHEVEIISLDDILNRFKSLESVEFGIDNASSQVANSVIRRFKNYKNWIVIQTKNGSKIKFPSHTHVMEVP